MAAMVTVDYLRCTPPQRLVSWICHYIGGFDVFFDDLRFQEITICSKHDYQALYCILNYFARIEGRRFPDELNRFINWGKYEYIRELLYKIEKGVEL